VAAPLMPASAIGAVLGLLLLMYAGLSLYSYRALHHELKTAEGAYLKHQREDAAVDAASAKTGTTSRRRGPWISTAASSFSFDKSRAEAALRKYGPQSIRRTLAAYIEPPLKDTVPGTGNRGNMKDDKDRGTPPKFVVPLPLRTHRPSDLRRLEYKKVETCHDLPTKFPIDRGLEFDEDGNVVVWNIGDEETPPDFPDREAPYCPVESDPFLPWIHDVFPSQDGSRLEFIAQNKRRCRTGKKFTKDVDRLVPQAALMQSVSVERISDTRAQTLAPQLWCPSANDDGGAKHFEESDSLPRYRLAPFSESSPDGMFTRFICRFSATQIPGDGGRPTPVLLGETLSEYPFNYEYAAYRKGFDNLLTAKGKDTSFFWASVLRFSCPVPDLGTLRRDIAVGNVVLSDGTPTVYLDLVPIRTSARYDEVHLTEEQIGPVSSRGTNTFDAVARWGNANVMPRVEASGRWSNIPVCLPPKLADSETGISKLAPDLLMNKKDKKPHFLSACLWASAEFRTRGRKQAAESDTLSRFEEWLEFHFMVGFDHVYLYDNSGAHTNETSLASVVAKYPGKITRIDWPAIPCNNNIPAHDSTGERSSQYAAENSCRTRFAPFTEYIASFDTDEYLVPMGGYTNLKDVIRDAAAKDGTQVFNFRSSRGKLRREFSRDEGTGIVKDSAATYLEAYNCDSGGIPKPQWAERARKQIYRSDFVLYHFVHYSTVTESVVKTYDELGRGHWSRGHNLEPKNIQRATDEMNEAVMIHSKTVLHDMTTG